jgi:hypothetical protein
MVAQVANVWYCAFLSADCIVQAQGELGKNKLTTPVTGFKAAESNGYDL